MSRLCRTCGGHHFMTDYPSLDQHFENKSQVAALKQQFEKAHIDARQKYDEAVAANERMIGGTHYTEMPIAPWAVVDTWPLDQKIGFYRGNLLKYTMRFGTKDEMLKEAEKALHYAQKLVEVLKDAK